MLHYSRKSCNPFTFRKNWKQWGVYVEGQHAIKTALGKSI